MPIQTVDDLLNFSGALPDALRVQARAGFLNEVQDLLAWHRARVLLALVRAEIAPSREGAAAAQQVAEEAKEAEMQALELLQAADKSGYDELHQAHSDASRRAAELRMQSQLAERRAKQLLWLETALRNIERPPLGALNILFDEVQDG